MTTQRTLSRAGRKREAIIEAAHDCILAHGYAATSMDMVAARACVSKATIYAYFSGKSDLFSSVVQSRCAQTFLSLSPPDSDDARAVLTIVAHHLLEKLLLPEILGMYRVVIAEAGRYPELAEAYWNAGPAQAKVWLVDMFERLHRRGALRVDHPTRAVDQFVSLLRGDLFFRALANLPPADDETRQNAVAMTVETICRAYAPTPAAPPTSAYRPALAHARSPASVAK